MLKIKQRLDRNAGRHLTVLVICEQCFLDYSISMIIMMLFRMMSFSIFSSNYSYGLQSELGYLSPSFHEGYITYPFRAIPIVKSLRYVVKGSARNQHIEALPQPKDCGHDPLTLIWPVFFKHPEDYLSSFADAATIALALPFFFLEQKLPTVPLGSFLTFAHVT